MLEILRFIHLLAVVVWIGMLIFFTFFAAPSIFKALSRENAGDVVGRIFPKYWIIGCVSGLVSLGTLASLSYMERAVPALRIIVLAVMVVLTFYSALVVGVKARKIKARMRAAEGDEKETFRAEFKSVHMKSAALNLSVIILGLVFIFLTSRGLNI